MHASNWGQDRREQARRGLRAGAALVLAAVAGQASAQIAPGLSGSSSTMTFVDNGEAFRTLNAFASCYARQNTAQALELIATEPASREESTTYRRMFRRNNFACLSEGTTLRMSMALVRGAIAEGLYKRDIALPPQLVQSPPAHGTVRTLSEAARCIAAARRERVQALVEGTRPGSREEYEALISLAADLPPCLPETARIRRFDPTQIRFRLAEALWRMPAPAN